MWGMNSILWDTVYIYTTVISGPQIWLADKSVDIRVQQNSNSWTQISKTFSMYTKGLFLSNIVHKSV